MTLSMTVADWIVLAAGIAAIAWVNWYFFLAEPAALDVPHVHEHGGAAAHVHHEPHP